ncbi:MAG: AAA-like domain-containing protein, partial [Caldilineales bacterium]|nr:AAA-like domain-containing protein [Caldilineales bacterium]
MRFFNTVGPVDCASHYCLPPLERIDLGYVLDLLEQRKYFILHAPRQTGKTSVLLALQAYLNQGDRFRCLYVNFEVAQAAREQVAPAMRALLEEIGQRARLTLNDTFPLVAWLDIFQRSGEHGALNSLLTEWCLRLPRPLVLLVDEIDSLIGDTLIAVLRQLRAGYDKRPHAFPSSIVLCGVR